MPKLCKVCGERKPELPDRNVMGRPIKRVCKPCHQGRLSGDMIKILEERRRARKRLE